MDGQALAGEYIGATASMEAIARHHTGVDVRVRWQPSNHWRGLARRTADGAEILINPYAPAAELAHILFHEIAHHLRGHVVIESTWTAAEMADDNTAARLDRLTPPEADAWRAAIDAREAEAEQYAWAALEAFERRFGPFLGAI